MFMPKIGSCRIHFINISEVRQSIFHGFFGQQITDRHFQNFFFGITEDPAGGRVCVDVPAGIIHNKNAIGGILNIIAEFFFALAQRFFRLPALGDVAHNAARAYNLIPLHDGGGLDLDIGAGAVRPHDLAVDDRRRVPGLHHLAVRLAEFLQASPARQNQGTAGPPAPAGFQRHRFRPGRDWRR